MHVVGGTGLSCCGCCTFARLFDVPLDGCSFARLLEVPLVDCLTGLSGGETGGENPGHTIAPAFNILIICLRTA